jgi:hypothetical protein
MWGNVIMPADMVALDLRKPEVMDRVRELGARIPAWGFQSVKMDFAYYQLLSEYPPNLAQTNVALYREAVKAFREATGREMYFINISMGFPNYGLVDAFRIGLDSWPCWEGGTGCPDKYPQVGGLAAQGIKPAARMAARRYWMNGRIWFNHNDQIFFRDLSEEEARAYITVAALAGGMISLGEDAATITPAQADLYRRILPLAGTTFRPLDLFEREFPEIWALPAPEGDSGRAALVGLFHWGQNRDLTQLPYAERADGTDLVQRVELTRLGFSAGEEVVAYEFWTGRLAGVFSGALEVTLKPHSARVYRLIPKPANPAFLGTNRHILERPGFASAGSWGSGGRLSGVVTSTPGFTQNLAIWVPDGMNVRSAKVDGLSDTRLSFPEPNLAVVSFDGIDAQPHAFEVGF